MVHLAEGESGILVDLLPAGEWSVLSLDLRFVGISSIAIPHCSAGIAFSELRAAGRSGVAAYGIALERARCLTAGWYQSLLFRCVLRYWYHQRHSGLCVLLGRVRVLRTLSSSRALARLGPSGARLWTVRRRAGFQGAFRIAARCRSAVRVTLASARPLEACGIVALDMA